jgi:hypothetical protein
MFELDDERHETHKNVLEALWALYFLIIHWPVFFRRQFHELCRENASSVYGISESPPTIDRTHVSSVLSTNFCNLDLTRRVKLGPLIFPFPPSPSAFSPSSSVGKRLL